MIGVVPAQRIFDKDPVCRSQHQKLAVVLRPIRLYSHGFYGIAMLFEHLLRRILDQYFNVVQAEWYMRIRAKAAGLVALLCDKLRFVSGGLLCDVVERCL